MSDHLCPQPELDALVNRLGAAANGAEMVAEAAAAYPEDPRLRFLLGSALAGERRYEEARAAMSEALRLAPELLIARFQLGFLEYTSGLADQAAATWAPLGDLAPDHPLRLFSEGLNALALDRLAAGRRALAAGIAVNLENPPLSRDMQRLLDALPTPEADDESDEPASTVQQLLRQQQFKPTRH